MIFTLILLAQILLSIIGTLFIIQMILIMAGILKPAKESPADSVYVGRPLVTVQLPIFNEGKLVEGLLESVTKLDYPMSKLHIQLLDDSTDETYESSKVLVESYREQGWDMELLHRENREGFKAGALNHGLESAKGEFLLILDADFRPPANFLEKTLPYFSDEEIGFVKTSVRVTNKGSMITHLYSSMVTMSTQLEQVGRDRLNLYQPISGSSFIIRKSTLLDAGCWSSETLGEDTDLSFELYLRSWKSAYVSDIYSKCYAPPNLKALWIQQYMWAKSTTQCFFKHWRRIVSNKNISPFQKVLALCSGSQYIVYLVYAFSFVIGGLVSLFFMINPLAMPLFFYMFVTITTPLAVLFPITLLYLFYKRGYSAMQGAVHLVYTSVFFYFIAIPVIRGVFSAVGRGPSVRILTPKES